MSGGDLMISHLGTEAHHSPYLSPLFDRFSNFVLRCLCDTLITSHLPYPSTRLPIPSHLSLISNLGIWYSASALLFTRTHFFLTFTSQVMRLFFSFSLGSRFSAMTIYIISALKNEFCEIFGFPWILRQTTKKNSRQGKFCN